MKKRILHPLLQRLAALIILGTGLGIAVAAIAMPLAEAVGARETARQRLMRFESILRQPADTGALYNPDDLSSVHVTDAEAQIALQAMIDRIARGAGVAVQSTQPLAAEHMGDVGRSVWLEMSLTCDLEALVNLLVDINTERPVVLVRRLDIERGDGPRPDSSLRIRLELGRAWRIAGATP